jgi:hypothetical protein
MEPQKRLKDVYKFADVYEVELASRCCRVWVDEDILDADAIALADTIIKVGGATYLSGNIGRPCLGSRSSLVGEEHICSTPSWVGSCQGTRATTAACSSDVIVKVLCL